MIGTTFRSHFTSVSTSRSVIWSRSPHCCQNVTPRVSVSFSGIGKKSQDKVCWVGRLGDDCHIRRSQKLPHNKPYVWDGALSWFRAQELLHHISGRLHRMFFVSHLRTLQKNFPFTIHRPGGTNSLCTMSSLSNFCHIFGHGSGRR